MRAGPTAVWHHAPVVLLAFHTSGPCPPALRINTVQRLRQFSDRLSKPAIVPLSPTSRNLLPPLFFLPSLYFPRSSSMSPANHPKSRSFANNPPPASPMGKKSPARRAKKSPSVDAEKTERPRSPTASVPTTWADVSSARASPFEYRGESLGKAKADGSPGGTLRRTRNADGPTATDKMGRRSNRDRDGQLNTQAPPPAARPPAQYIPVVFGERNVPRESVSSVSDASAHPVSTEGDVNHPNLAPFSVVSPTSPLAVHVPTMRGPSWDDDGTPRQPEKSLPLLSTEATDKQSAKLSLSISGYGPRMELPEEFQETSKSQLAMKSASRLTRQFPDADLELGLKDLLLRAPRSPDAMSRIRALWDILWATDRIKKINLAALMMEALARHGFHDDVAAVMLHLHNAGIRLRIGFHESILHQITHAKRWRVAIRFILLAQRLTGGATRKQLNWYIRALMECGEFAAVDDVMKTFTLFSVQPDRRTFNLIIQAHMRNRNPDRAMATIRKMEEAGFPLNHGTWAAIVTCHGAFGLDKDLEMETQALLRSLRGARSPHLLNNLVADRLSNDDWNGAFRLLVMFHPSPLPQEFEFSASPLAVAFAAAADVADRGSGPPPSGRTFANVMSALLDLPDFAGIAACFRRMQDIGLPPIERVIEILILAHVRIGSLSTAGKIVLHCCGVNLSPALTREFKDVCDFPSEDAAVDFEAVPPTSRLLNALLPGVLESKGLRGAILLFRVMHALNLRPDSYTIGMLMKFFKEHMHVSSHDLSELVVAMVPFTSDNSPALAHLNAIIQTAIEAREPPKLRTGWKAFIKPPIAPRDSRDLITSEPNVEGPTVGMKFTDAGGANSAAGKIQTSLSERGVLGDNWSFHLRVWHEAVLKGDLTAARSVLLRMAGRGMQPEPHHFAALMRGQVAAGHAMAAEKVLYMMKSINVEPTVVLYTIVVHGYGLIRRPSEARRVFQDMLNSDIKPDVAAIDALAGVYVGCRQDQMARAALIEFWPYISPFPPELGSAPLSELITRFRQLEDTKQPSEKMFSWDGGVSFEGGRLLPRRERRRFANEIRHSLVRESKAIFNPGDSTLTSEVGSPQHTDSGIFYASRFRKQTLRRISRRIWMARRKAIAAWERKHGRPISKTGMQGTLASIRIHPLETAVLRSWDMVRKGALKLRIQSPPGH